jgi:hypothetical protein
MMEYIRVRSAMEKSMAKVNSTSVTETSIKGKCSKAKCKVKANTPGRTKTSTKGPSYRIR